ncbi:hypothetical protein N9B74_01370 [bacterium]|nr:hypothetical protein [bacterium]
MLFERVSRRFVGVYGLIASTTFKKFELVGLAFLTGVFRNAAGEFAEAVL